MKSVLKKLNMDSSKLNVLSGSTQNQLGASIEEYCVRMIGEILKDIKNDPEKIDYYLRINSQAILEIECENTIETKIEEDDELIRIKKKYEGCTITQGLSSDRFGNQIIHFIAYTISGQPFAKMPVPLNDRGEVYKEIISTELFTDGDLFLRFFDENSVRMEEGTMVALVIKAVHEYFNKKDEKSKQSTVPKKDVSNIADHYLKSKGEQRYYRRAYQEGNF